MSEDRGINTSRPHVITRDAPVEDEQILLGTMNEGYARLADDSKALAVWRAEQRIWESTLADGLLQRCAAPLSP